MSRKAGTRRALAAVISIALVWMLARYMLGIEIDSDAFKLLVLATVLSAVLTKHLHQHGDKLLRWLGL